MRKSFKFLRDNSIYSKEEEHGARALLMWLIISGEYETTIYPKNYQRDENEYIVHGIRESINNGVITYKSDITIVGGGIHNVELFIN